VSLAASLRLTAQRLIRQYGEPASLVRMAVTGSETGTTVQVPTNYTFTAALTRRGKSLETGGSSAVLRQFASGGRVLAGDEEAIVAAADLAVEPKPSDRFSWGATARRVVDTDVYRVQGVDIAYRMGLSA
jgi:hypothetical protein